MPKQTAEGFHAAALALLRKQQSDPAVAVLAHQALALAAQLQARRRMQGARGAVLARQERDAQARGVASDPVRAAARADHELTRERVAIVRALANALTN